MKPPLFDHAISHAPVASYDVLHFNILSMAFPYP